MTNYSPLAGHELLPEKYAISLTWSTSNHRGKASLQTTFIHSCMHSFICVHLNEVQVYRCQCTQRLSYHRIIELWCIGSWENIGKHDFICCHYKWATWVTVTNTVTCFCRSPNSCFCDFWSMKYLTLHSNKKVGSVLLRRSYVFDLSHLHTHLHLTSGSPSQITEKLLHKWEQALKQLLLSLLIHTKLILMHTKDFSWLVDRPSPLEWLVASGSEHDRCPAIKIHGSVNIESAFKKPWLACPTVSLWLLHEKKVTSE